MNRLFFLLMLTVGCAPAMCCAENAFTRFDTPPDFVDPVRQQDGQLQITESNGTSLVAENDVIRRTESSGTSVVLECDEPEGTGSVWDMTLDPAGPVMVAAANGMFVVGPDGPTVERFALGRQIPQPIRSIAVGDFRRLWFITDDTIGCIHLGTRALSLFTAKDGLPDPGYRKIRIQRDGSLILQTEQGQYRYRPDDGLKPTVAVLSVQGGPFSPSAVYGVDYECDVDIKLAGTGRGNIQFRVIPHERNRYFAATFPDDVATIRSLDPGRRKSESLHWIETYGNLKL